MTAHTDADRTDRYLQPPAEEPGAPESLRERRFEHCGSDWRPRDEKALYPVGTRFAAVIGWW